MTIENVALEKQKARPKPRLFDSGFDARSKQDVRLQEPELMRTLAGAV